MIIRRFLCYTRISSRVVDNSQEYISRRSDATKGEFASLEIRLEDCVLRSCLRTLLEVESPFYYIMNIYKYIYINIM